jgi:hypothetical protein
MAETAGDADANTAKIKKSIASSHRVSDFSSAFSTFAPVMRET